MTTYRVKVTASDIALGERDRSDACPVARALKHTLSVPYVQVGRNFAFLNVGDEGPSSRIDPLPVEVQYFIATFDRGGFVQPFEFEVTL